MFKRRMLEGSAGYRQLKCNDCHKSSKASGVTLLALRSKRPSLAMLLWDTTIYTGTTSFYLEVLPSLKKKEESFFKKYKLKSVVFSYSWFLTSLLQRANKTKALFWHSIRELSSLQWKLHHFKSRLENHPASKQSGMFKEATHYKVCFVATAQLLLPLWTGTSLKARTISRTSVNSHTMLYVNKSSAKLISQLLNILIDPINLNFIANFLIIFPFSMWILQIWL